jgi:hypothetical protein
MRTKKAVFIEGHIMANRMLGEASQPFCIHSVMFNNGKCAIVRAASGVCFNPGETIERSDCEWFFKDQKIHLLPFQYIKENESQRELAEY